MKRPVWLQRWIAGRSLPEWQPEIGSDDDADLTALAESIDPCSNPARHRLMGCQPCARRCREGMAYLAFEVIRDGWPAAMVNERFFSIVAASYPSASVDGGTTQ